MPRSDDDVRRARILAVVDSIPRGRVATYGQVAREAGLPRRARLVGRVLATLQGESGLPWHRVINAQGKVSVRRGAGASTAGRIDLARYAWTPTDEPASRR